MGTLQFCSSSLSFPADMGGPDRLLTCLLACFRVDYYRHYQELARDATRLNGYALIQAPTPHPCLIQAPPLLSKDHS